MTVVFLLVMVVVGPPKRQHNGHMLLVLMAEFGVERASISLEISWYLAENIIATVGGEY